MVDFWEKRFDVLVCTTIVESGLDVSNANTMIIERADMLGLSQLHQLRGRVGRGRERAYAYFLYPPEKPLTETAHDRLATIAQHTDLGGGMAVAMKDLEIRGAGNLLGGEQSGHIADVGFDLYVRLVGEAVAEYRGDGRSRSPRSRSSCRSTRTCRTTTCRASGCGWRCTSGWPRCAPTRTSRDPRGAAGPVRRPARAGGEPARGRRFRAQGPRGPASPTSPCRASTCGSRRWSCRTPDRVRLDRVYPKSRRQAGRAYDPRAPSLEPPSWVARRSATRRVIDVGPPRR